MTVSINGTDFMNNTFGIPFSPYTDLFQNIFGNGNAFFLVPLIALTIGIWYKTEEPIMASMFMIGAGAILGMGSMTIGLNDMGLMFTIFSAIGLTILIMSFIFGRRE